MPRTSHSRYADWQPALGRTCILHHLEPGEGETVFPWLLQWLETRGFTFSQRGKKVRRACGEERGFRLFFRAHFLLVLKRKRLRILIWATPQLKGLSIFALWNWFLPFILFGLYVHLHLHLNALQDSLEEDLRQRLADHRPEPAAVEAPGFLSRRSFYDHMGGKKPQKDA